MEITVNDKRGRVLAKVMAEESTTVKDFKKKFHAECTLTECNNSDRQEAVARKTGVFVL